MSIIQNETPQAEAFDLNLALESAKNGNNDAFSSLKERYKPLLESQVLKHTVNDMMPQDIEDLREEAFVIFCNAVCNFDLTNVDVEFGLYAKICIENGLTSFVRSYLRRRKKATVSLESAEKLPASTLSDPLQAIIDKQRTEELVRNIKKNLSDYENRVWWMYVSGMSVSEIANAIGSVEPKSVSNAIYRIRKKLRTIVEGN